MEKIFIQIASYRDPECQWTVKDLFQKAAHPERIFIGICWQFDENEDRNCFIEPNPYLAQIRTLSFHPSESHGSGWAHMQAQSLWNGEEYVLQIHAHMRFEQNWDNSLIDMLGRCPSQNPALSTCLAGYVPPNDIPYQQDSRASFVFVNSVTPEEPQLVNVQGALVDKNEVMTCPTRTPFWVGNFLFAKAAMFEEVPFDPHLQYYGEPLAYSARLFTHGYDLFEPDQHVLYHWWGRNFLHPRPYRDMGGERQKHSFMRLKHLLRLKASPESAALTEMERYGLGTARSINEFWDFSGIDVLDGSLTDQARKGRWDDSFARYTKLQAGQKPTPPRIFVQIASYRDPECQWTVKDLFEKAILPDRVFVGICWQHDPDEDKEYFRVVTRPSQVSTALFHWKESQGVCWARHQTQLLWQGEEYTLMIDSHMRFEFGWDQKLIDDLALCPSPKAVLSNYPAAFTPPHNLEANAKPTVQRPHPYTDGDIRFRGDNLDRTPEKPLRGAFIAAGLLFAKSEFIREIPYDFYLYFNQEELSLATRLFTHGWDVYHMRQVLVYHLYITDVSANKRPLHWQDNPKWLDLQERARKRMDHMMGYVISDDPVVTRDLMKYGLGTVRTLDEFSDFCGIDFKRREISDWALRCGFIEGLNQYKDGLIFIPEVDGVHPAAIPTPPPKLMSFADPEQIQRQPFNIRVLANNTKQKFLVRPGTPIGILVIQDYLERSFCDTLLRAVVSQHSIDTIAPEVLTLFNDIFGRRLAPFYRTCFDWYERPQPFTVAAGTESALLCDAEEWNDAQKTWSRAHDRDYSTILCLNDGSEGTGIHLPEYRYTLKPAAGMLISFPSDYRYRYMYSAGQGGDFTVLSASAAAQGAPRAYPYVPFGAVYLGQR